MIHAVYAETAESEYVLLRSCWWGFKYSLGYVPPVVIAGCAKQNPEEFVGEEVKHRNRPRMLLFVA